MTIRLTTDDNKSHVRCIDVYGCQGVINKSNDKQIMSEALIRTLNESLIIISDP